MAAGALGAVIAILDIVNSSHFLIFTDTAML